MVTVAHQELSGSDPNTPSADWSFEHRRELSRIHLRNMSMEHPCRCGLLPTSLTGTELDIRRHVGWTLQGPVIPALLSSALKVQLLSYEGHVLRL